MRVLKIVSVLCYTLVVCWTFLVGRAFVQFQHAVTGAHAVTDATGQNVGAPMSAAVAAPVFFIAWLIPVVTLGMVGLVCQGMDKKKRREIASASLPTP